MNMCVCGTNKEDDVRIEVDAQLDAVDDLLSSPTRNPKVGNESHYRHREKPGKDKLSRFRIMAWRKHIKRKDENPSLMVREKEAERVSIYVEHTE